MQRSMTGRAGMLARSMVRRAMSSAAAEAHVFDADIAVKRAAEGRFEGFVHNRWSVGDAPNGGMLTALALNAAKQTSAFKDPLSASVHFCNKTVENAPIDLFVETLNAGKTTETVSIVAKQQDKVRFVCTTTLGDLTKQSGLTAVTSTAPDLPPLDQCVDGASIVRFALRDALRIANQWEFRLPQRSSFARGILSNKNGTEAVIEGWVAFAQPRPSCSLSSVFLLDAFPPPVLNLVATHTLRGGAWVPTIEYTAHNRAIPTREEGSPSNAPQWLRARFHSRSIMNGTLTTDGELWSQDGSTLLAESRQSARLLLPRSA